MNLKAKETEQGHLALACPKGVNGAREPVGKTGTKEAVGADES